MSSDPLPTLWPRPQQVNYTGGRLQLGGPAQIIGDAGSYAAQVLAGRLNAPIVPDGAPGNVWVALRVVPRLPLPADLPNDRRVEAYRLEVGQRGVTIEALTEEGLLRGAATLLHLLGPEGASCPCVEILDWPFFRFRCASDWLINVECNRWAYDWGDGVEATIARMERKLDMCFSYKINQVWFDGFGWSLDRTPHYARVVRHLSRYARQRGIRLTFAGYGGGYGTSYQKSELYRYGYHGQVFENRRPYPDGEEYLCCGLPGYPDARRFGTCLSNAPLQEAKIAEMAAFVSAVEPGFLYVHDIDAGHYSEAHQAWLMRCDQCRRLYPNDEMAAADGHAGAMAAWCRRLIEGLRSAPTEPGYDATRDLSIVFTSPVYTHYQEPGQPEVWRQEVEYFRVLSELIGPAPGVLFGLREQFLDLDGHPRIAALRAALDEVGNGHGALVISFLGGDCYLSDELVNASCCLSHLFEGAQSVCLSNGAVHEEPLQLVNAQALWCGPDCGFAATPGDGAEADALANAVVAGTHRPAELYGNSGALHQACRLLWGDAAAEHMYRVHTLGEDALTGPVHRVWWSITREVRRLRGDLGESRLTWEDIACRWQRRVELTREAIEEAEAALRVCEDEGIRWLVRSLEVGLQFAEVVLMASRARAAGSAVAQDAYEKLDELQRTLEQDFDLVNTDVLGGDPGCWLDTIGLLRDAVG